MSAADGGGLYVDTSVVGRAMLGEDDTSEILDAFGRFDTLVSSRLLAVELCRLAARRGLPDQDAPNWLAGFELVPLDDSVLDDAGQLPPAAVGTLDAIHLATAIRLARDGIVGTLFTFDRRLAAGARHHGLAVIPPAA